MRKNKGWRGVVIGAGAFILCLVLYLAGAFQMLEWKSWDLRLRWLSDPDAASDDIVLILIDQNSLDLYAEQGISWPWWRQMYVPIINFCNQGGARAVFFDFIFSESSAYGVEDDQILAEAMQGAGNILLPMHLSQSVRESAAGLKVIPERFGREPNTPATYIFPAASATIPINDLLQAARGIGNTQIAPDDDGIFRRIPLFYSLLGKTYPVLPLAVAEAVSGKRIENIPADRSGRMVIKYFGPSGTYTSYSAAAVINAFALQEAGKKPQLSPYLFHNKVVLVGGSAPGILDLRPTPFSAVFSGTEIHAAAIDNLLQQDYIRFPSWLFTTLILIFFAMLAGLGATLIQKTWQVVVFALFCFVLPAAFAVVGFLAGYWIEFIAPEFAVLTGLATAVLFNYNIEGRQRRFIKRVFHFYLSPHVINRVLDNPELLKLGGDRREVSSFFSDVAGFTSISESLSPEDLVHLLNEYLTEMTDVILKSGGTLDKYEGDAIIAFWNAPLDFPDHAVRACRAALLCQEKLTPARPHLKQRFGHELTMRIGVNSGPAVVGNMGSHSRFDYTAMGDTINLAARLEGACKMYGVDILIGENTYASVKDMIVARNVDLIRVVGKSKPVHVYEILGEWNNYPDKQKNELDLFHKGLDLFRKTKWDQAQEIFAQLKSDKVAGLYLQRIQELKDFTLPDNWDGVFDLKTK